MDPIYKPLNGEEKRKLEEKGYKEWEYMSMNKWNDPDSYHYNLCSALVLGLSIYGRHFTRKHHQPCGLFTMNIMAVPIFYFMSFKYKHVDQLLTSYRPRPSFNETLEFYPVTRRAWKRAMIIREKEMDEIKSKLGNEEPVGL